MRVVPRDEVAQADGRDGDEDKIKSIKSGPVWLEHGEDEGGEDEAEQEQHGPEAGQVHQPHLTTPTNV